MGARWPWLATGVALLGAAWLGPLPELAERHFTAHMTLHMGVVAVAAPLVAWGLAGGPFDPVRWLRWRMPGLGYGLAIGAALLEMVIVWAWHAPALHRAARAAGGVFALEQACFLGAGLAVWLAVWGGDAQHRGERDGAGAVALLLTSMHMTLLGTLLTLAGRPLYGHPGDSASSGALVDQQIGGAIMLGVGGVVYLAAGLGLVASLLRRRAAPQPPTASEAA